MEQAPLDPAPRVPPIGPRLPPATARAGWLSRQRVHALALVAATLVVLYGCYLLVEPFLPALAWGLALAVVAYPMHKAICRRIPSPNVAAALAVVGVTVAIIGPVAFVTQQIVQQAVAFGQLAAQEIQSGRWQERMENSSRLAPLLGWLEGRVDAGGLPERLTGALGAQAPGVVTGSVWVVLQLLVTLFVLFYFFRDRRAVVGHLRALVPLSETESVTVFRRVTDTIHATVFGAVAVAAVQGFMGGLIFWVLGLPAPLLWGTVMGVLATMPVLGTFVVWAPTAVFLAFQGSWVKAIVLASWGAVAISLIDNLLYPILVGGRLRLHPLPVFFSIVGGLFVFGAAGVILGPVLLSVADALLDIWRRRTSAGRAADEAPAERVAA